MGGKQNKKSKAEKGGEAEFKLTIVYVCVWLMCGTERKSRRYRYKSRRAKATSVGNQLKTRKRNRFAMLFLGG